MRVERALTYQVLNVDPDGVACVECPFCEHVNDVDALQLRSRGHVCESCGAAFMERSNFAVKETHET